MFELGSAKLDGEDTFQFWCDSTVPISMLNTEAPFKLWCHNQKTKILDITLSFQWRNCPGEWNCSEIVLRGTTEVSDLLAIYMWFHGPRFLYLSRELWPEDVTDLSPPGEAAEKEIIQVAGGVVPLTQIIVFDPGGKILQPWKVRKVDQKC